MTAKIKELAIAAGLIAPYASGHEGLANFDFRRFAELILDDCEKVIRQQQHIPVGFLTNPPVEQVIIAIQKHFGVIE